MTLIGLETKEGAFTLFLLLQAFFLGVRCRAVEGPEVTDVSLTRLNGLFKSL